MLIITNIHYSMKFLLSMYQGIPHSAQMFQNTDFVRHNTLQPGLVADDHIKTSEPNQLVVNTAQILSKVSVANFGHFLSFFSRAQIAQIWCRCGE
jgi:hypothetical protein